MGEKVLPENQIVFSCAKLCSGTGCSPNTSNKLEHFLKHYSLRG